MDRWAIIRQCAARVLANYEARTNHPAFGPSAGSSSLLTEIAHKLYDLTVAPDDELPENISGRLDLDEQTIGYRADQSPARRNFTIAHELGHRALAHPPRKILDTDEQLDETPDVGALTVRDGVYRAYNERDRWELEANVFAAELLAPIERVRSAVLTDPDWTVRKLAGYFGLSRTAMLNQLSTALLPGPAPTPTSTSRPHPALDDCQREAAEAQAPVLVIAGPGAGKTRVLTERFARLVAKGTPPERILALTFSNKAAEEMRERLVALLPEQAHAIQVKTFHALGLELLQNYGRYLGLKPDPKLLTQVDAFIFLRGRLGELPLGRFEDLYRPTSQLRLLLSAISRAKDELVGPDEFEQLVADWRARVATRPVPSDEEEGQRLASEEAEIQRCADVAAIYKIY